MKSNSENLELNLGLAAQTQFFHLFKVMFDSGDVQRMGSQAFTIYAYIKSCVNYDSSDSFPTVEVIVKDTGISRAQVFKELPKLVEMGYLASRKQGRKTIYTLCEKIPLIDDDGNVQTTATWEYIPRYATRAVQELQDILRGDQSADKARFVHIENLQVIVSNLEQGATQNVYNGKHEVHNTGSEGGFGSAPIALKTYIAQLKETGQELPEDIKELLKMLE